MSIFHRYTHLERYGKTETKGIEQGTIFLQSKLDGTSGLIFWNENGLQCGSRNRHLTPDEPDNQGFRGYVQANAAKFEPFFQMFPSAVLYGEFLIKNVLNCYLEDAWKKFYVFDMGFDRGEFVELVTPEQYQPVLDVYGITYVPTVAKLENYEGDYSEFFNQVNFLIDPSHKNAHPEGLVIKNYNFLNVFRRNTFAKIVFEGFKEQKAEKGLNVAEKPALEVEIAEKYVTEHLVQKELAKLKSSGVVKLQPALLQTVFYVLLTEEIADIVKKYKLPLIDFKSLNRAVINQVKVHAKELF